MILDLRKADLEAGKTDPFISMNNRKPTPHDLQAAEERAEIYQECIDYANGDPTVFMQELTRRMVDPVIIPNNKTSNKFSKNR